jgi:hypothetical protein
MVESLQIVYRPLDTLIPYIRNSRTHDDAQVAQIAASIREFGFTNPVLIDADGGLIAGHGRVLAARKLGLPEVPTIELGHLSETQRRAYVIADNKLALNAGWDEAMLALELQELDELGFDIDLTGFTQAEIEALTPEHIAPGLTDEDAVPVVRGEPVTRIGDVWILGNHRLMCGSCTDVNAVDKLMNGRNADLCLTDPPYGLGKGKESGKNDYAEYEDTRDNLIQLAKDWLPIAVATAKVVVFSPGVTNQWLYPEPNWVMCWFYGGGQLRSSWGFNCWQPFLCYGKEPGLAAGQGARPDAVDMNTPANAGDLDHPCPKPVKLWAWFLDRLIFSDKAVMYEPFSGSGTTLIAAEQKTGVSVMAMELTPHYVDVAVRRWQEFTGKTATLEADGRTFDQVANPVAKAA